LPFKYTNLRRYAAARLLCDGRLHHVFVAEDCAGEPAVADTVMAGGGMH
jgi:hypothetical protein